jgi:hypothetical protein
MPDQENQGGPAAELDPDIAEALEEVRKEAAAGRSQGAMIEIIGTYPVKAEEPS